MAQGWAWPPLVTSIPTRAGRWWGCRDTQGTAPHAETLALTLSSSLPISSASLLICPSSPSALVSGEPVWSQEGVMEQEAPTSPPPGAPQPSREAEYHLRAAARTTAPFPECPKPPQAASATGKWPLLTSQEALPMLPGDHPAGGRVAGRGTVVPGVHQTVASLAGVVPATREHTGCQGGQSRARTALGSQDWSILFGSSARSPGAQQCPRRAQAAQASLPSFNVTWRGEWVRIRAASVGCSQRLSLFFPTYKTPQQLSQHLLKPSGIFSPLDRHPQHRAFGCW